MLVKGILDESVSWQELSEVEKQYHRLGFIYTLLIFDGGGLFDY